MSGAESDARATVDMELFVRSFAPNGARDPQRETLERLDHLVETGAIETYSVTVVGPRICPTIATKTDEGRSLLRKLERLHQWAVDTERTLEPYFTERRIGSMVDDAYTVLVPPVMCLAVYEDDQVWGVFPSDRGGRQRSVWDCLESFEAEQTAPDIERDPSSEERTETPPSRPRE